MVNERRTQQGARRDGRSPRMNFDREARERRDSQYFDGTCHRCGCAVRVPFKPSPERELLCKDCLRAMRTNRICTATVRHTTSFVATAGSTILCHFDRSRAVPFFVTNAWKTRMSSACAAKFCIRLFAPSVEKKTKCRLSPIRVAAFCAASAIMPSASKKPSHEPIMRNTIQTSFTARKSASMCDVNVAGTPIHCLLCPRRMDKSCVVNVPRICLAKIGQSAIA